jgi:hypothetical protein
VTFPSEPLPTDSWSWPGLCTSSLSSKRKKKEDFFPSKFFFSGWSPPIRSFGIFLSLKKVVQGGVSIRFMANEKQNKFNKTAVLISNLCWILCFILWLTPRSVSCGWLHGHDPVIRGNWVYSVLIVMRTVRLSHCSHRHWQWNCGNTYMYTVTDDPGRKEKKGKAKFTNSTNSNCTCSCTVNSRIRIARAVVKRILPRDWYYLI